MFDKEGGECILGPHMELWRFWGEYPATGGSAAEITHKALVNGKKDITFMIPGAVSAVVGVEREMTRLKLRHVDVNYEARAFLDDAAIGREDVGKEGRTILLICGKAFLGAVWLNPGEELSFDCLAHSTPLRVGYFVA